MFLRSLARSAVLAPPCSLAATRRTFVMQMRMGPSASGLSSKTACSRLMCRFGMYAGLLLRPILTDALRGSSSDGRQQAGGQTRAMRGVGEHRYEGDKRNRERPDQRRSRRAMLEQRRRRSCSRAPTNTPDEEADTHAEARRQTAEAVRSGSTSEGPPMPARSATWARQHRCPQHLARDLAPLPSVDRRPPRRPF